MKSLTWQRTIVLVAMLGFSAFVLWLTAANFDQSELKSILLLAVGFVVREFLPIASKLLKDMGQAFEQGGQVE
jgi:hypothetical protein